MTAPMTSPVTSLSPVALSGFTKAQMALQEASRAFTSQWTTEAARDAAAVSLGRAEAECRRARIALQMQRDALSHSIPQGA